MTIKEAEAYVEEHFPYDEGSVYCALVKLRHKAVLFPEIGVDGSLRDSSEWAYIDASGKIDTGEYGEFYYFG